MGSKFIRSGRKQRPKPSDPPQRPQCTGLQSPVENRSRENGNQKTWTSWLIQGRNKARNALRRRSVQEAARTVAIAPKYFPETNHPGQMNGTEAGEEISTVSLSESWVLVGSIPADTQPTDSADLARSLRIISTQRARVRHERYGVQEDFRHLQNQINEVAKVSANLMQEIESVQLNDKLSALTKELQGALDGLAKADSELDYTNERLLEQERLLKDAEGHLYRDVTGQNLLHEIDLANDVLNRISSLPSSCGESPASSRVANIPPAVGQTDQRSAGDPGPYGNRTASDRGIRVAYEQDQDIHEESSYEPWQVDLISLRDLDSDVLDTSHQAEVVNRSEFDDWITWWGSQFSELACDSSSIKRNLELGEEDPLVQEKRAYDLAPVLQMKPIAAGKPFQDSELPISRDVNGFPDLQQSINAWLLEVFANSWLQFSHLLHLSTSQLNSLTSIIGLINLGSLIQANWSCAIAWTRPAQIVSVYPSLSSVTNDIPRFFTQIVELDGEIYEPRYCQLNLHTSPSKDSLPDSSTVQLEHGHSLRDPAPSSNRYKSDPILSRVKRTGTSLTEPILNNNGPMYEALVPHTTC